jgi:uncharacterized protein (TIGR00251 family)
VVVFFYGKPVPTFPENTLSGAQPAWTQVADGIVLSVRLTPKGGRDAVEGIEHRADGRAVLKARVRAPPSEGAANAALITLLADVFDVPPRAVTLQAGATARIKRIKIAGDPAALAATVARVVG